MGMHLGRSILFKISNTSQIKNYIIVPNSHQELCPTAALSLLLPILEDEILTMTFK